MQFFINANLVKYLDILYIFKYLSFNSVISLIQL